MRLKRLFIGLILLLGLSLTSCNAGVIGKLSFHYIHVQMYGMSEPIHYRINKWVSDDGNIEVRTNNYGTMLVGDGFYVLYENEICPICGAVTYK